MNQPISHGYRTTHGSAYGQAHGGGYASNAPTPRDLPREALSLALEQLPAKAMFVRVEIEMRAWVHREAGVAPTWCAEAKIAYVLPGEGEGP